MEHRAASLKVVLAGFQYVRARPCSWGLCSLDLFVVLLGGAIALMPIFANEVLHLARAVSARCVQPRPSALSLCPSSSRVFPSAAKPVHACLFASASSARNSDIRVVEEPLALARRSGHQRSRRHGQRHHPGSLLQLATPPEMRGRVSAVNSLFIGASNELGEFESGLTAQWWGAVRATIFGGLASLAVAGTWAAVFPGLRRTDELSAAALRPKTGSASLQTPAAG